MAIHDTPQHTTRVFVLGTLLLACGLLSQADTQLKWVATTGFHKQPGFWSVAALAGMAGFALLALLQERNVAKNIGDAVTWSLLRQWFGPAEYALYFLLYVYAVPYIGYLPATLLAFSLLILRLGYRDWKMLSAAWVVGITIVVLFKSLLQVKIPGGALYTIFSEAVRNFLTLYL